MISHRCRRGLAAAFLIIAVTSKGLAVIGVTLSMADLYESAREVVVAEVVKTDADARTIGLKTVECPKGESASAAFTLHFPDGVELPQAKAGQPAIVFVGRRGTSVHVADGWLAAANPTPEDSALEVTQNEGPNVNFPGPTEALIRVIEDVRVGKKSIVYEIEHFVFKGGIRPQPDIMPQPKAIAAADVNGDGWEDVLVVGAQESKLFLNHAGELTYAPAGISKATGLWAATGYLDRDKRPDFLVGDTLWLNEPGGFRAGPTLAPLPAEKVLAAGIFDANGDRHPDVLLATAEGEVIIFTNPGTNDGEWTRESKTLWTGGEPVLAAAFSDCWNDNGQVQLMVIRAEGPERYTLDPNDGPPVGHLRLAGFPPSWGGRWEIYGATVLDVDGNGLPDFYGSGPSFGAIINGRGFGTFLSNYSAKRVFGHEGLAWGELTPRTVLGSADLHGDKCDDLLVATEDGHLFEVDNPNVKVYY